jgi:uncharacterized membrane protein
MTNLPEDEDRPIFEPGLTEKVSYGPSWGSIIGMGIVGIVLLILILLFA